MDGALAGRTVCTARWGRRSFVNPGRSSQQAIVPVCAWEQRHAASVCSEKRLGGVFDGHRLDAQCLDTSSDGQTCPHPFSTSSAAVSLKTPAGSMRAMYSVMHMERALETTSWRKLGMCCVRN